MMNISKSLWYWLLSRCYLMSAIGIVISFGIPSQNPIVFASARFGVGLSPFGFESHRRG